MRKSFDGLLADPFIRTPDSALALTISSAVALWDHAKFTPVAPEEVRAGKLWRVTAFGDTSGIPGSVTPATLKLLMNNSGVGVPGSVSVKLDTDNQYFSPAWALQAIFMCRYVNDNIGGHSSAYSAGGFFTIGGNTYAIEPSNVYDVAPADVVALGASLSSSGGSFSLSTDAAFIEALN